MQKEADPEQETEGAAATAAHDEIVEQNDTVLPYSVTCKRLATGKKIYRMLFSLPFPLSFFFRTSIYPCALDCYPQSSNRQESRNVLHVPNVLKRWCCVRSQRNTVFLHKEGRFENMLP
jgi:hypothetical protein